MCGVAQILPQQPQNPKTPGHFIFNYYTSLLLLINLEPLDLGSVVQELGFEKHICVLEQSFLETDDDELAVFEEFLDH